MFWIDYWASIDNFIISVIIIKKYNAIYKHITIKSMIIDYLNFINVKYVSTFYQIIFYNKNTFFLKKKNNKSI